MSRVQFNGWWAALANSSFNQLNESLKECKQACQHALHTFTCVSGVKNGSVGEQHLTTGLAHRIQLGGSISLAGALFDARCLFSEGKHLPTAVKSDFLAGCVN